MVYSTINKQHLIFHMYLYMSVVHVWYTMHVQHHQPAMAVSHEEHIYLLESWISAVQPTSVVYSTCSVSLFLAPFFGSFRQLCMS